MGTRRRTILPRTNRHPTTTLICRLQLPVQSLSIPYPTSHHIYGSIQRFLVPFEFLAKSFSFLLTVVSRKVLACRYRTTYWHIVPLGWRKVSPNSLRRCVLVMRDSSSNWSQLLLNLLLGILDTCWFGVYNDYRGNWMCPTLLPLLSWVTISRNRVAFRAKL